MALGLIIMVGLVQICNGTLPQPVNLNPPLASPGGEGKNTQTSGLPSRELRGPDPPGGLRHGEDAIGGSDRSGLPAGVLRLQRLELPQLCHGGGG